MTVFYTTTLPFELDRSESIACSSSTALRNIWMAEMPC